MGNPLVRVAIGIFLVFIIAVVIFFRYGTPVANNSLNATLNASPSIATPTNNAPSRFDNSETTTPPSAEESLAAPTDEFKQRITKKFFGTYVTPSDSPVKPERFSGYHTGVDVEYSDTTRDVPVFAIADGKIIYSQVVSGYGGVFVMQYTYKGNVYLALYGHIRPSTLPEKNSDVAKGKQIAMLGNGNTQETDFERHHLHFSIRKGTEVDIRGYVQNESDLSEWINPLTLYP